MKTPSTYLFLFLSEFLFFKKWKNLALWLAFGLSLASSAQAQSIEWDKTVGGNKNDVLSIVQPTQDGGYILGGSSLSNKSGDKSENGRGKEDYWVIKLDSSGNKQWDKTFGSNSFDFLTSLQQTQDGGYILGGTSQSTKGNDKTEDSKGRADYWIVKIDATGNKQWDKTFGGSYYEEFGSLQQTLDGGYILGGQSYSSKSGDKSEDNKSGTPTLEYPPEYSDYWVIKIDANGIKQWDKTIGGSKNDILRIVQNTPNGGYILGGTSSSGTSGDKSEPAWGNDLDKPDYWVVKLDDKGQKEWDRTIGGTDYEDLLSLINTSDGAFLLGGHSSSGISGNKTEAGKGDTDYWIVKVDASGKIVWDRTIGGPEDEYFSDLTATSDNGFMLGGYSESGISNDKTTSFPGPWLVKLRADGTKAWDKTFTEGSISSVQLTLGGDYIVGGYIAPKNEKHIDYWVIKLTEDHKKEQIITHTIPLLGRTVADGPFTLTAQASSGLPVSYTLLSGSATLKENILTPTGAGKIQLKLAQLGNATYSPAPDVFITIIINYSVPVSKVWDRTLGGTVSTSVNGLPYGYAKLSDLLVTADGGYLLGGTSDSEKGNDKSANNKGYSDYWVVKLDANGQKIWDKTFGGNHFDKLTALAASPDGGYLLAGYSDSDKSGDKSENSRPSICDKECRNDYWIVKIDANGNKLWDRTFGGNFFDFLFDVIATPDGGFLLGGSSASDKSGDKSQSSKEEEHTWLIKIDANGNKIWDKTLDRSALNGGATLSLVATTNGFLVGGVFFGVVQLDLNGNIIWSKSYDDTGSARLYKIISTPDNGFLLGGENNTCCGTFGTKYWVIKIDANGKKIWDKSYRGYYPDGYFEEHIQVMAVAPDGNYLLGGSSAAEFGGDKSEASKGYNDYWLLKVDTQGNKIWDKTLGSYSEKNLEEIKALVVAPDGGYVLGGTAGFESSGDKSEVSKGAGNDYWIIKIQEDQPTPTAWDMRYGGNGTDNFTSMIKTSDGGYLAGGYTSSGISGDKSQPSQGKNDYWIVKTNKNGKKLWEKRYGGSGNDYLNHVIQTQDGGYLLAGSSLSNKSGDKSAGSRGDRDYWIVKTDALGNQLWDKTFGGTGYDELKKVVQLSTGQYILGGYSNSPVSGDKSQDSRGGTDYWVVKLSYTGTKLWDKRYGGSQSESLGSFSVLPDGGLLLGGTSSSGISGDKTQSSQGGKDFWLVRVDIRGNKIWDKRFGGAGDDELYSMGINQFDSEQATYAGDYFVGGTSSSGVSGEKSQPSQGGKDFWLVQLHSNGNLVRDLGYGGTQDEELRSVIQTQNGDYLLAGSSYSGQSGDKSQTSKGMSDYWVLRIDAFGKKYDDQSYGGSGQEELRYLQRSPDGGFVLGGRSDSGVSGDKTQPSQGGTDYWLVKVPSMTSSVVAARTATPTKEPIEKTGSFHLQAYPNPFQEKVIISFTLPESQAATLRVLDSQGREVATLFQEEVRANQTYQVEWQAGVQQAGMYLLQLQTPTKQETRKLLLTK